jgi:hypothetical protein
MRIECDGESLCFIFGHRLSTIPRALFLLEALFCPLAVPIRKHSECLLCGDQ